jgi:hypothetical protein
LCGMQSWMCFKLLVWLWHAAKVERHCSGWCLVPTRYANLWLK